jgi:hypothetical protein
MSSLSAASGGFYCLATGKALSTETIGRRSPSCNEKAVKNLKKSRPPLPRFASLQTAVAKASASMTGQHALIEKQRRAVV